MQSRFLSTVPQRISLSLFSRRAYALDVQKGIPMRLNTEMPTQGHERRKMPTNQKSEEEVGTAHNCFPPSLFGRPPSSRVRVQVHDVILRLNEQVKKMHARTRKKPPPKVGETP